MDRLLSGLVVLTIFSSICIADVNSPDNPKTLEEYAAIVLAGNAGLRAQFEEYKAATEQITQAKVLPDPTVKFGYATEETPTGSTLEFMQEIPWFGTIPARTAYAAALSKVASKKYDGKRLEILNEMKRWFYEYCFLYNSIRITTENAALGRQLEKVAREKYAAMTTEHPDIIKAQMILANLEYNVEKLNAYRQPLVAKLNSLLNRSAAAQLDWPQRPPRQAVSLNFDVVYTLVLQNNPDLSALGYNIEVARSGIKLAEKRFYPNVGLGVAIDEGMGRDGGTRVMPVIAVNIPLWRDSYKAGERQAVAMLNQSAKEKEQKQNDLAAATGQTLYEFEDSLRRIHLYNDILIPRAKEHFITSQNAYQTGTFDFLTLLDSLQTLYDYQLLYERAEADNAQKLAELEALTAIELSKEFPENKSSWNPERNMK